MEKLVREVVALRERVNALEVLEAPAPISDHGDLSGLGDDDHAQYLTAARHTAAHAAARVYHNANQSIQHNTHTTLAFNSVRYDTGGMYDPDNSSRLTCQVAGLYLITGHVAFEANANGHRRVYILATPAGGSSAYIAIADTPAQDGAATLSVATAWYMEPGDYVQLQVRQTSGRALAMVAVEAYSPEFTMTRIG